MIYGLHNLLRHRLRIPFSYHSKYYHLVVFILILLLTFYGLSNWKWLVGIYLFASLIYSGILNTPYLYLVNIIAIKINRKFFKQKVFVYFNGEKLKLRKNAERFDTAKGIIMNERMLIDNDYEDKIIPYEVEYCQNLSSFFADEVKDTDSIEKIKKKLILYRLIN